MFPRPVQGSGSCGCCFPTTQLFFPDTSGHGVGKFSVRRIFRPPSNRSSAFAVGMLRDVGGKKVPEACGGFRQLQLRVVEACGDDGPTELRQAGHDGRQPAVLVVRRHQRPRHEAEAHNAQKQRGLGSPHHYYRQPTPLLQAAHTTITFLPSARNAASAASLTAASDPASTSTCKILAYVVVLAYIVMADIVMASSCKILAYVVLAYIAMADIVMASTCKILALCSVGIYSYGRYSYGLHL